MSLDCLSFFAGIGGIDIGFEQAGFNVVYANEFDKYAKQTYEYNIKGLEVDLKDIKDVDPNNLPNCDVIFGGFPCQAFSIAGKRQGFQDQLGRGLLFFEMARIIQVKKPRVVFLENVKNLVSHDKGNTINTIVNVLVELGYKVDYKVMNASEYGNIAQNRERIYIVAFKYKKDFERFQFPEKIKLTNTIKDNLISKKVDERFYYTDNSKIYPQIVNEITNTNTIYQWRRKYVRENKSNLCPTLTANMGTGGHNVPLIKTRYGIRKLTPKECINFQGFPKYYEFPDGMSLAQSYKQAGNSVCVPVVKRIAQNILKAIK